MPADQGAEARRGPGRGATGGRPGFPGPNGEIAAGRPETAASCSPPRSAGRRRHRPGRAAALAGPATDSGGASGHLAGDRVTISWDAEPGPNRRVAYQVVRTRQRQLGRPPTATWSAWTDGNELATTAGRRYWHYTVFAMRSDGVWSPGAALGRRSPPSSPGQRGRRRVERPGHLVGRPHVTGSTVLREPGENQSGRNGFSDDGLKPGVEYRYDLVRRCRPGSPSRPCHRRPQKRCRPGRRAAAWPGSGGCGWPGRCPPVAR